MRLGLVFEEVLGEDGFAVWLHIRFLDRQGIGIRSQEEGFS